MTSPKKIAKLYMDKQSSEPKSYFQYLESIGFELSPNEIAGHRNFLQLAEPLKKELQNLVSRHAFLSFKAGGHFTKEDSEILQQAVRILDSGLVPLALLKEKESKGILRLR
jgi:hypothetical protein